MSRPPEPEVDVSQLASEEAELEKHFPVSDFDRLRDVVASAQESGSRAVRVRFRFAMEQGCPVAVVDVDSRLPLTCQRCLEPVEWQVRSSTRIVFVDAAGMAAAQTDDREPFETHGGRVALREVVEEELLLALPLVATHPATVACRAHAPMLEESDEVSSDAPAQLPFAGLKELLGRK
ncbi:MAG TPA: YceD family protein [Steroidobacteraceae bacterium]|nr:YceD family protein [Steroidobacteraceae bacterium]